jgi:hypothetical protein
MSSEMTGAVAAAHATSAKQASLNIYQSDISQQ